MSSAHADAAESEIYSQLQPVIGANVMDFRLFAESAAAPLHTSFPACCPEAPQLTPSTDFIIHFIELPRFIHRYGIPHNASSKKLTIGLLKMYPKKGTIKK